MPTGIASPSVEAAAQRRVPSSSPVGRIASSDSIEAGGFAPGVVLAERYRIIGLLGRGGMGEVYRADDLKLGQPVALKFLPRALSNDAVRRERFFSEVRLARQVSHPNVCRVYDVGEIDGQHYLSMEFVDGEDLSSLLKRIGRLPHDKALEIARQLCAGLAAAHDRGVLHRDLKPANVMLDGRGRARITDFGLAVAAADGAIEGELAGTPAYMAPEQLAGKGASVKSDLYALGLVIYEVITGRKAFDAATHAGLKKKHAEEPPAPPSSIIKDLDPAIERVILRCLEKEPAARPASALQVAASLPGGDPLAAALAAGETPSPEMVAAAGEQGALSPAVAWSLLGSFLALLFFLAYFGRFSTDIGLAPLEKSPDALADRAREIVRMAGFEVPPADTAIWVTRQYEYLLYRAAHLPSPQRVRELASARPHPYWFFYRQSPRPLVSSSPDGKVGPSNPPLDLSGMVTVALDAGGRLVGFHAVPPEIEESKGPWTAPDWRLFFSAAGLDLSQFAVSGSKWIPPVASDAQAEWDGAYAGQPGIPIHVSAAAFRGRLVYFRIRGPWDQPGQAGPASATLGAALAGGTFVFLVLLLLGGGLILARRNMRLQRGDRHGALRIAFFALAVQLLGWVLGAHHVSDFQGEFGLFIGALSHALFWSVFLWIAYMALEPYWRRRSPQLLVSWTRVLSGRFRDPLVGRDVLIGLLLGAGLGLVVNLGNGLPAFWNVPGATPLPWSELSLVGPASHGSLLFQFVSNALSRAIGTMALLVVSRMVLRRQWLAVAASFLVLSMFGLSGENFAVEIPATIAFTAILLVCATRFGILAMAVAWIAGFCTSFAPFTLDFSRWYAGRAMFDLLALVALAVWGFWTSLAGRPAFGEAALDDEGKIRAEA